MNRRKRSLLSVLANQLRFVALPQIARFWFAGQRHATRRAARMAAELADSGWVRVTDVLARPVWPLFGPVFSWQHAQPAPDFTALSRRLHQRALHPAALTTVVSATPKTRALLGPERYSARRIKLTQTTHDLYVAELFFRHVRQGLPGGTHWVSEDALPLTWPLPQRPDALLVGDDDSYVRALEYGGDYAPERLMELHDGLASMPLAYEIW